MEIIKKFNYAQFPTLEERAKWFAYYHHGVTLHMYGGQPYFDGHLTKVVDVAKRFIHLIREDLRDPVLAACWAHDTIEDTRVTYNDVKSILGEEVAELVYAVTNEKGKNRKTRAGDKYYRGIRATPRATFVKLCDRIANIEASGDGSMRDVYRRENEDFYMQLHDSTAYDQMWIHLDKLLLHYNLVGKEN